MVTFAYTLCMNIKNYQIFYIIFFKKLKIIKLIVTKLI
jgi:hypothetical protein